MKKININIIALVVSTIFFSINLFAGDEPSLGLYPDKASGGVQFELCWLPGEKPTGTLALNGSPITVKASADCVKTSVMKANAPYSFEIDGKVFKYSVGGAYVLTNPLKATASKAGVFSHSFTFGANELPAAGLTQISINGVSYKATHLSGNSYRVSNVPSMAGRMVMKAAGKTFIYDSETSGTIVKRTAPQAKILATGEVELEYQPNEIPDNLTKVRIGGVDYAGMVVGNKFVTTAKTFSAQLGHKMVMNMKGATRSFSMAATAGAPATLLSRDNPSTKLTAKSSPTCGQMELTWNDPLEVPQNLRSVEVNGENYTGTVVGGKFTTNNQVECSTDGEYDMKVRDYDDPVTHSEVLPIELSSFDVRYSAKRLMNVVNWTIESAVNVSRMELLRSYDGENFSIVHTVKLKGSAGYSTYQYNDDKISFRHSGWVYYKLRNVDHDGSIQDHKVVTVKFEGRKVDTEIAVFPNPARDIVNINSEVSGNILIYDQLGQIAYESAIAAGTTQIELIDLPSGMYFGKFISEEGEKQSLRIQIAK